MDASDCATACGRHTTTTRREGNGLDLWINLLFGNPVGLLSVVVICAMLGIGVFDIFFFIKKSGGDDRS